MLQIDEPSSECGQIAGVIIGNARHETAVYPAFKNSGHSEPPGREDKNEAGAGRKTCGIVGALRIISAALCAAENRVEIRLVEVKGAGRLTLLFEPFADDLRKAGRQAGLERMGEDDVSGQMRVPVVVTQ